MTRLTDVFPGLKVTPVIGILRGLGSEEAEMAAGLALEAGIPLIEVTLDTEGAFDQIERLTDRGVTTGAGSVLTENAAERAFSVGAAFIITPAVVPSVVRACAEASIPCIPGAATPTEITMALDLGAAAVKVFPADLLGGPAYLRAIRRPLHDPPLIPTGESGLITLPNTYAPVLWRSGSDRACLPRAATVTSWSGELAYSSARWGLRRVGQETRALWCHSALRSSADLAASNDLARPNTDYSHAKRAVWIL